MTTIAIITVGIVLAKVYVAFRVAERIEREQIPNEDATPRDLNPRRPASFAAWLNLSRAVRRMH